MTDQLTEQDLSIRLFIYQFFVENGRPPTPVEAGRTFDLSPSDVRESYKRLHEAHAIFIDQEMGTVRMAHPFSAVATPYQVTIGDVMLYANCAWDSVGISAMLKRDATIRAFVDDSSAPVLYGVENGSLVADPKLVVHFPVRVAHWYDDLIHT